MNDETIQKRAAAFFSDVKAKLAKISAQGWVGFAAGFVLGAIIL